MSRTPPDAAAPAVRAVAYVRVSQARVGMISPELQLTAIQAHCRQRGYGITATLEDLDLSGRFWDRRQVERAICLIEDGEADVLVVWRWSRVTRDRLDWAVAVNRVEAAGGRLESATEDFDTTTSTGRLARGILAELAAFESERMGDVWNGVRERRIRQGQTSHGQAMFGYRKRNGRYVQDRTTGPLLVEMYRRYTAGESFHSLARWLNDERVKYPSARTDRHRWTKSGVARCMDTGFAAGHVRYLGQLHPGTQNPLITEDTWQEYLTRRAATGWRKTILVDDFLLTDLAYCSCGNRLSTYRAKSAKAAQYRCLDHPTRRAGQVTMRHRCDGLVESWLHALIEDPDTRALVAEQVDRYRRQLVAQADAVRDSWVAADADHQALLHDELERARSNIAAVPDPVQLARDLFADWAVLTARQRRDRVAALATRVEVHNDLPNPVVVLHTTWGEAINWSGVTGQPASASDPGPGPAPAGGQQTNPDRAVDPLQLLTPHEAAAVAGVEPQTVRNWWAAGLLPNTCSAPDGRSRLYAIGDLRKVRPRPRPTGVASTLQPSPGHSPSRRPRPRPRPG